MKLPLSAGVALLALAASVAAAAAARAAYIVTFSQIGPDVVASGSGTIDLNELTFFAPFTGSPDVAPISATETTGAPGADNEYLGVGGPLSFGPGGLTHATTGTGDLVGVQIIIGTPSITVVPAGYVSGAPLSDTATYAGQSFATLGLTWSC